MQNYQLAMAYLRLCVVWGGNFKINHQVTETQRNTKELRFLKIQTLITSCLCGYSVRCGAGQFCTRRPPRGPGRPVAVAAVAIANSTLLILH